MAHNSLEQKEKKTLFFYRHLFDDPNEALITHYLLITIALCISRSVSNGGGCMGSVGGVCFGWLVGWLGEVLRCLMFFSFS